MCRDRGYAGLECRGHYGGQRGSERRRLACRRIVALWRRRAWSCPLQPAGHYRAAPGFGDRRDPGCGTGSRRRGPLRQDALAIGICLWAALGGLQVALAIRTRRAPDAGHLAGALRKLVRWMAALAMIAIIVIVIVNLTAVKANSNWLNTLQGRSQRQRQPKHPPRRLAAVPASSSYLLYVLIAVVVLVALVICVVLISRIRARGPGGYVAGRRR